MAITERFIRDVVMPEIEASGGATVLTSPYAPPSLLKADKFQPPTWVVGIGSPATLVPAGWLQRVDYITLAAQDAELNGTGSLWSAVGFWLDDLGRLYIEPVETFTNHYMALDAAKRHGQDAIYALHTASVEYVGETQETRETQAPAGV